MATHPNICPYVDIPLQHASQDILKAMGRSHDIARNLALVEELRHRIPGVALRTTFITGFPGETDRDFRALMDFVDRVRFDHVGVFMYSDDTDLPSNRLADHVDDTTKQARLGRLMARQAAISRQNNEALVGTVQRVLVEGTAEGDASVMVGRTARQAPEIDGIVYIEGGAPRPGTFVDVTITKAHDYDLTGQVK
jgi:ribosomal protein S12 methylthiotransferase